MRRILVAAAGGAAGAGAVAALAAASPWRPTGWWVAPMVVLVAVPVSVAACTWLALRLVDRSAPAWPTARLAALGTPLLAVFSLMLVVAAAGPDSMGVQQTVGLCMGAATAAALAERFTPTTPG